MVSVGTNLLGDKGDHERLIHLLNNYRTLKHKLISYIHPKGRGAIVQDLSWYLSLRIQNHAILEFEHRSKIPMDDVGFSLTSRLQQVMESPQYQISFFSEANLRAFLKSTLDDPNPLPYRFPISHEVIATLLSSFLGFGAVNAEEWGDVNEEMMFEMGEIQALLSNNKSHFYPPPPNKSYKLFSYPSVSYRNRIRGLFGSVPEDLTTV